MFCHTEELLGYTEEFKFLTGFFVLHMELFVNSQLYIKKEETNEWKLCKF